MAPASAWHNHTSKETEENLIIAMAGSAAQCKMEGRKPYCWTYEGRSDREKACNFAADLCLDAQDFSQVTRILDRTEVWDRTLRLADLLVKYRHIYTTQSDYF